jgi:predicted nucleic acid-binding protein
LDAQAAAIGGQLEAKALTAGHDPGMADAGIAGIAAAHELIVATRNTQYFLPSGIAVLSPDEAAAQEGPA